MKPQEIWNNLALKDPVFAAINIPKEKYVEPSGEEMPFRLLKDERILDMGCGWGRVTVRFAQKLRYVIGMDISIEMLKLAKKRADEFGVFFHAVCADIAHLPFKENSFDKIYSTLVLIHVSKEDARKSVDQISTCLNKNGIVHITLSNKFSIDALITIIGFWIYQILGGKPSSAHIRFYSLVEVKNIFGKKFDKYEIFAKNYYPLNVIPSTKVQIPKNFILKKFSNIIEKYANNKIFWLKNFCISFNINAYK